MLTHFKYSCSINVLDKMVKSQNNFVTPFIFLSILSLIGFIFKVNYEDFFATFRAKPKVLIPFFIFSTFNVTLILFIRRTFVPILLIIWLIFFVSINLKPEDPRYFNFFRSKNKTKEFMNNFSFSKFIQIMTMYFDIFLFFSIFCKIAAMKCVILLFFILLINTLVKDKIKSKRRAIYFSSLIFIICIIFSNLNFIFEGFKNYDRTYAFTPVFFYKYFNISNDFEEPEKIISQILFYIENIYDFLFTMILIFKTLQVTVQSLKKNTIFENRFNHEKSDPESITF